LPILFFLDPSKVSFMSLIETVLEEIADNLDQRRMEITNLRRVIQNYIGKPLETTAIPMAIPMLYAHWEGYVREVCQLYLEYIEASGIKIRELRPDLLGYLWTPALKPLVGGLAFARKRVIAELALTCMENPVKFAESERIINTKSNLNFEVLRDIAANLCLDISALVPRKNHLDALVSLRNNIAHGARPRTLDFTNFEEHASSLISLMEEFERSLIIGLEQRSFFADHSKQKKLS
jgi:hypothetical protein